MSTYPYEPQGPHIAQPPAPRPATLYSPLADVPLGQPSPPAPIAQAGRPASPAPAPRRRRLVPGLAAVAVAALALTGVKLFVIDPVSAGATSAPDATIEFANRLADLNIGGIGRMISPAEARLIPNDKATLEEYLDIQSADRGDLGVLLDSFTIDIEDLTVEVGEEISFDVQRVDFLGGKLTIDGDVAKMREAWIDILSEAGISSTMTSIFGSMADVSPPWDELEDTLPLTIDFADVKPFGNPLFLIAVEESGKWYISPLLTIAEYVYQAAKDSGIDLPRGRSLALEERQSFSSPVEAANGLKDALSSDTFEVSRLASVLPTAEGRLVSIYGPTIAAAIDKERSEAVDWAGDEAPPTTLGSGGIDPLQSITWSVDELSTSLLDEHDGWARLGVDSFKLRVASDDLPQPIAVAFTRDNPDQWSLRAEFPSEMGEAAVITGTLTRDDPNQLSLKYAAEGFGSSIEGDAMLRLTKESIAFALRHLNDSTPSIDIEASLDHNCLAYTDRTASQDEEKICKGGDMSTSLVFSQLEPLFKWIPDELRLERLFALAAIKSDEGWNVSPSASLLAPMFP